MPRAGVRRRSLVLTACLFALALLLLLAGGPDPAAAQAHVIATIPIGDGGYEPKHLSVNPDTNRIYVTHQSSDRVSVVDGTANTVVATVPVADENPGDIAVNPVTNRIYVANPNTHNISVIDGATDTPLTTVSFDPLHTPTGVAVNPNTNRVYVPASQDVFVIDGETYTVVATIPVGSWTHAVAANPNTNRVYVTAGEDLIVIDGATNSVVATVPLGSWSPAVAVNAATNRIYAVNGWTDSVSVIDGATNTVLATVPAGRHPAAVAVNPAINRIYVTNADGASVIDGATNALVSTIAVGHGPVGVVANPVTSRVYVGVMGPNEIAVIDGATNTVIARVLVGRGAWSLAVSPITSRVYVANGYSDDVSVIDGATNTETVTIPVGEMPGGVHVGGAPKSIAINPATNRIYVASWYRGEVWVIDGGTEEVIAKVWVGGTPGLVAVNPVTSRIYAAGINSTDVAVIDGATNILIGTIPLGYRVRGLAVNPAMNRIYAATETDPIPPSETLFVIDGATNTVVATVPVGQRPAGVAVNPATNRVYVANAWSDSLSVIDGATDTTVTTIPVGDMPVDVAVSPITNRVYVTNSWSNDISVIDGATDTVTALVGVGESPRGVAVNPVTNRIYVANHLDDTVSVIEDLPPTPMGPDVSIAKGVTDDEVTNLDTFFYFMDIKNEGDADATDVVVQDTLPEEVRVTDGPVASQGSCMMAGEKTFSCELGTIPPGETAGVALTVEALCVEHNITVTNTATVTAAEDTDPTNNTSSIRTRILADTLGNAPCRQKLAEKFSPILFIDENEDPYDPKNVGIVLNTTSTLMEERKFRPDSPIDCDPSTELIDPPTSDCLSDHHQRKNYIDLPGNTDPNIAESTYSGLAPSYDTVTFAHITEQSSGGKKYVGLQYWFFYYFNNWFNDHEGDWEMIQLTFEADSIEDVWNNDMPPKFASYSQHLGGHKRDWEGTAQSAVCRAGNHPKVYVGIGSHANYFAPGIYLVVILPDTAPSEDAGRVVDPSVVLLPESANPGALKDSAFKWLRFNGKWGQPGQGPRGPALKEQWDKPFTWGNRLDADTSGKACPS